MWRKSSQPAACPADMSIGFDMEKRRAVLRIFESQTVAGRARRLFSLMPMCLPISTKTLIDFSTLMSQHLLMADCFLRATSIGHNSAAMKAEAADLGNRCRIDLDLSN